MKSVKSRKSHFLIGNTGLKLSMVLLALLALPIMALADTFPSKPVTMIVPYRAGGSTDVMARILAKAMRKELGKPVIIVNRVGGGGSVGATFLKQAAPDGYTIMMGADEIPILNPLLQKVEFNMDDFHYLAAIAEYQTGLVTLASKPYKTLNQLVEYSKKHPGITCALQGPTDKAIINHIIKTNGLDWKTVSTGGGGEAMQLLLGEKIDVSYSGGVHSKFGNKLTVLASFNKNRLAGAPDKPSLDELGYNIAAPSYAIFMTHVKAPAAATQILERAIIKASKSKDFKTIVEDRLKAPVIEVGSKELKSYLSLMEKQLKPMFKK